MLLEFGGHKILVDKEGLKCSFCPWQGMTIFWNNPNDYSPPVKVSVINYGIKLTCFVSPNCSLSLSGYG